MTDYRKDPDATLDYSLDWSPWLGDDTIASSEWGASDGINVLDERAVFTDTTATVWLSGGTAGTSYKVTNRITTAGGRVDDRTIRVRVEDR